MAGVGTRAALPQSAAAPNRSAARRIAGPSACRGPGAASPSHRARAQPGRGGSRRLRRTAASPASMAWPSAAGSTSTRSPRAASSSTSCRSISRRMAASIGSRAAPGSNSPERQRGAGVGQQDDRTRHDGDHAVDDLRARTGAAAHAVSTASAMAAARTAAPCTCLTSHGAVQSLQRDISQLTGVLFFLLLTSCFLLLASCFFLPTVY